MFSLSGTTRRKLMAVAAVSITLALCLSIAAADLWTLPIYDDFEDGNYTSSPTWQVGGVPGSTFGVGTGWNTTQTLNIGLPAAGFPPDFTWAGAAAVYVPGDQGVYTDLSLASPDPFIGAGATVRYAQSFTGGIGTGYAAVVRYMPVQTPGMYLSMLQLNGNSVTEMVAPQFITSSFEPVWVQIRAEGVGASTIVLAGAGALSQPKPPSWWTLDSSSPGAGFSGVTSYYDAGYAGLVIAGNANETGGGVSYDNVRLVTPEPGTMALILFGAGALASWRKRRKNAGD